MKVTLDIDPACPQDEIVIRCAEMNDDLLKIISLANSSQRKVVGSLGRQTFLLEPGSVYYFESVDDRIFVYTEDKVYDLSLIHI